MTGCISELFVAFQAVESYIAWKYLSFWECLKLLRRPGTWFLSRSKSKMRTLINESTKLTTWSNSNKSTLKMKFSLKIQTKASSKQGQWATKDSSNCKAENQAFRVCPKIFHSTSSLLRLLNQLNSFAMVVNQRSTMDALLWYSLCPKNVL